MRAQLRHAGACLARGVGTARPCMWPPMWLYKNVCTARGPWSQPSRSYNNEVLGQLGPTASSCLFTCHPRVTQQTQAGCIILASAPAAQGAVPAHRGLQPLPRSHECQPPLLPLRLVVWQEKEEEQDLRQRTPPAAPLPHRRPAPPPGHLPQHTPASRLPRRPLRALCPRSMRPFPDTAAAAELPAALPLTAAAPQVAPL